MLWNVRFPGSHSLEEVLLRTEQCDDGCKSCEALHQERQKTERNRLAPFGRSTRSTASVPTAGCWGDSLKLLYRILLGPAFPNGIDDGFPIVNEVIPHVAVEEGVLIPIVEDDHGEAVVPEDQVVPEEKSGKEPSMYLMDSIKKGFSSHTSVIHEGIKHIHKFHDSLQPKLHDILKAHIKGGAADDVCPIVRVYHKNCGRPCTTHKHCKDPHYACCKVICDDPWDKHSLKKGLYCHRMIEGKLPFQQEPEPWDTHDDHWGGHHGDSHSHLLEMLFKPKKKPPHHDVLGDKKIYLVGR